MAEVTSEGSRRQELSYFESLFLRATFSFFFLQKINQKIDKVDFYTCRNGMAEFHFSLIIIALCAYGAENHSTNKR